jgi:hypothetical protein
VGNWWYGRSEHSTGFPHGRLARDGGAKSTGCPHGVQPQIYRFLPTDITEDPNIPKISTDSVLVIARDHDNFTPTPEEYSKFYEVGGEDGLRFIDYQSLLTYCRTAVDSSELRNNLDGLLPSTPTII